MSTTLEKIYSHNIDLDKNILKNARLNPLSATERLNLALTLQQTDEGLIVYDKDEDVFYYWDGFNYKRFNTTTSNNVIYVDNLNFNKFDLLLNSDGFYSLNISLIVYNIPNTPQVLDITILETSSNRNVQFSSYSIDNGFLKIYFDNKVLTTMNGTYIITIKK